MSSSQVVVSWVPIVALLIPIVIVPTILGFRHARRLADLEHAERMRALELGRPAAGEDEWSPMTLAMGMGVGTPIGALLVAWQAGRSVGPMPMEAVWHAAGMIGVAGVICGTIIATRRPSPGFTPRDAPASLHRRDAKPDAQPEDYDFAGHQN